MTTTAQSFPSRSGMSAPGPFADRFASNLIKRLDGCWVWIRFTNPAGYGITWFNGRHVRAHRLAWELTNGPIPDDMHVLHNCDNPPCCNPAHLFLGTHADNMADKAAKGRGSNQKKTHCRRGHLYDEANTYSTLRGYRDCRKCRAFRHDRYKAVRRLRRAL